MSTLKTAVLIFAGLLVVLFLNYYLPSKDVVRIVGTDVKRMDIVANEALSEDGGPASAGTRDVRFINAAWPDGGVRVYRNEETGWGFPWYFKFDSGNLQAMAQDAARAAEPQWMIVTHYGWRIEFLSMFPNAVGMDPAPGPDHTPVPWFNIVLIGGLLLLGWWLWAFIKGVRERHVDPLISEVEHEVETVTADLGRSASGWYARWQRWLDTWRAPNRKRRR